MKGIALTDLKQPLHKVSAHVQTKPAVQIKHLAERLTAGIHAYAGEYHYERDVIKNYQRLPLRCFTDFSFDELCKLKYSSIIMMDKSVCELFEERPDEYRVVEKIRSSMWRWGCGSRFWNEVVDAYNGIRKFNLGLSPAFDIRLDYTTGYNPYGHSEHTRTFLDGTFAFLVYFRGKHVMTIGFSVMAGRVLLLQQVQLKEPRGNRFLYQFPTPYMQQVITCMKASFPRHKINLIDGNDLMNKTERDYTKSLNEAERSSWNHDERVSRLTGCLEHLRADRSRIERLYENITPYSFTGRTKRVNHLKHHEVV